MSVHGGGSPPNEINQSFEMDMYESQENIQEKNNTRIKDNQEQGNSIEQKTNRKNPVSNLIHNFGQTKENSNQAVNDNSLLSPPQKRAERPVFTYKQTDTGPYHVYVENNTPNFNGKLNPVKVGDIVLKVVPEIDNKIKTIESIGKNRVRIAFKTSESANKLIRTQAFLRIYNLDVYVPKFILHRQGVFRIDTEYSDKYLKEKIKP